MNNPYISIVLPIMRPGGLDVVFNSLEAQIFKDFELIIIDSLYHYRKDIIKEHSKKYSFKYKHIPTIIDNFPTQSYCHAMNTGIANAKGDVILFSSDYRYFMPDTLQNHANFHKSHADNIGYAPPSKFMLPPAIKSGLPAYGNNENYKQYVQDLKDNKLQDYMWSIFEDNIFDTLPDFSSWKEVDRLTVGYDSKTDVSPGVEVSPLYIYLQSESIKTKILLAANGLNEALDGGRSYQDIELSHRLRNMFDFKWIGDNANPTYKITGGHKIIDKMKLLDETESVSKSIFEKYSNGSKDAVNNWSISKIHNLSKNTIIDRIDNEINNRESTINFFGRTFKGLDWRSIPGNNGINDPWLDEEPIRQKYWNSFTTGQVIIDIGACFGLYTLPALMQGCKVISVEPNKDFSKLIEESVNMNPGFANNYKECNIGIWNKTPYPVELEQSVLDWCKMSAPFITTTIDDLTKDFDRVDMIKIDVEGAELGILEGAVETIKRFKPSFLIEDHTGIYDYCTSLHTGLKIKLILLNLGYKVNVELFGGPPPPNGGRYFIIATPS